MKDVSLVNMDSGKTGVSVATLGRAAVGGQALWDPAPCLRADAPLCRGKDCGWPNPGPRAGRISPLVSAF